MIEPRLRAGTACLVAAGIAVLLLAARPARADDLASARDHFKRGQTHYSLGEFERAAAEFREAYRLRDEPAILFNIAQSFRRAGNAREAYSYYSQFLERKPAASNRADVERFMEQMRRKVDAEAPHEGAQGAVASGGNAAVPAQTASAAPAEAASPAPAATSKTDAPPAPASASPSEAAEGPAGPGAPSASPAPEAGPLVSAAPATAPTSAPADALRASVAPNAARDKSLRYAALATVGVGIGAELLAVVFHASAQSSANELSRKYQAGALQASDASLRSDMDSKGRLSTIAAIGGAVLIAAGTAAVFTF